MLVPLVMWQNQVTTEAENDEFLTYILRTGRIMWLIVALVDLMELDLLMTALDLQPCAGYHLVFSFLDLGLGEWVESCILSAA
jgi:hypothetical protein